jgi:chromate reductase
MAGYKVGYFVGSLATKSINRLLAQALVRLAPSELQMTEISFRDLPLYSYDYDASYPPVATEFKNAIAAIDAVLFVTPECKRSIPGGLKNAIEWASRPYGQNALHENRLPALARSQARLEPRSRNNTCGAFCRSAIHHR